MKKILFPLMAVAVLAGCSKENSQSEEQVEIKLASQALEATTRAPFEGTIGKSNPLKAFVPASSLSGNYGSLHTYDGPHGYMLFSENGTTAVGFVSSADWATPAAKHYPADPNEAVYLCGLYPHDAWTIQTDGTKASAEIDGKTDLMAAKEIPSTKKDVQAGGTSPTLAFKHLLTRLNIELSAENDDAKTAWGNVTGLKISKAGQSIPATQAAVTLASGSVAADDFTGTDATACYTAGTDANITPATPLELATKPARSEAYTLCPPVDASSGTEHYTLEITTTQYTTPYIVPLTLIYDGNFSGDKSSTAGQAFAVTLTFKASTIQAYATVAPWEEAGTSGSVIQ